MNNLKNLKKSLAALLVAALLISLMPAMAFTEEVVDIPVTADTYVNDDDQAVAEQEETTTETEVKFVEESEEETEAPTQESAIEESDEELKKEPIELDTELFSTMLPSIIGSKHQATLTSNGDVYDVTLTYGPEAEIPDGSWLRGDGLRRCSGRFRWGPAGRRGRR